MTEDPLLARVRARDAGLLDRVPRDDAPRSTDLLLRSLESTDPAEREAAAVALAARAEPRVAQALRAHTADAHAGVRLASVASLMRLGKDALFPEVIGCLASDDPRVVAGAAVALGRFGDRSVVPNLISAFQTDDAVAGAAIAWALGQLGDRAVLPWLIAAADQGFVATAAADALGRLRDPAALPTLLSLLGRDEAGEEGRTAAAARAFGRIGVASSEVTGALEALLQHGDARVRLAAALALYELGEGAAALERELDP